MGRRGSEYRRPGTAERRCEIRGMLRVLRGMELRTRFAFWAVRQEGDLC